MSRSHILSIKYLSTVEKKKPSSQGGGTKVSLRVGAHDHRQRTELANATGEGASHRYEDELLEFIKVFVWRPHEARSVGRPRGPGPGGSSNGARLRDDEVQALVLKSQDRGGCHAELGIEEGGANDIEGLMDALCCGEKSSKESSRKGGAASLTRWNLKLARREDIGRMDILLSSRK